MYLVQLLLPTHDNNGRRFPQTKMTRVKTRLTRLFGGITMYKRSPAEGLSTEKSGVVRDDIIIFEVMTEKLDTRWWTKYRRELEKEFAQDRIIARVSEFRLL